MIGFFCTRPNPPPGCVLGEVLDPGAEPDKKVLPMNPALLSSTTAATRATTNTCATDPRPRRSCRYCSNGYACACHTAIGSPRCRRWMAIRLSDAINTIQAHPLGMGISTHVTGRACGHDRRSRSTVVLRHGTAVLVLRRGIRVALLRVGDRTADPVELASVHRSARSGRTGGAMLVRRADGYRLPPPPLGHQSRHHAESREGRSAARAAGDARRVGCGWCRGFTCSPSDRPRFGGRGPPWDNAGRGRSGERRSSSSGPI